MCSKNRWLVVLFCLFPAWGADSKPRQTPTDLTQVGLEELMEIEVTSVSKKEQKLSQAAAAVHVITQEDIRRAGATSIAEALRMVPGLQVARIDSEKWAISARGFNGQFADKMLVLMDGRSVYSPLFSGVFWDIEDTLLEDIDRIEVIRGPGATMWGANAVNAVINIITKHTKDTVGGLTTAGGGTEDRGLAGLRYGARLGGRAHYRVFAKYLNRNHLLDDSGLGAKDEWSLARSGFRVDWEKSARDTVMVEGDLYGARASEITFLSGLTPPYRRSVEQDLQPMGGSIQTRWTHTFSERSDLALQIYYDRGSRRGASLYDSRNIYDLDFQHRFQATSRHEILWGFGYRFNNEYTENTFLVGFYPDRTNHHLVTAFVQDQIVLVPGRLHLVLGSKFERNSYTGFEGQPSIRLLWTPATRHTAWAAVSRAVRTPADNDRGLLVHPTVFPGPDRTLNVVAVAGSRDFGSEDLLAHEIGYRAQISRHLSADVAAFYNVYTNLETSEPGAPLLVRDPVPYRALPTYFANKMSGETYGVEVSTHWNVTSRWRLSPAYSWLRLQMHRDPSSRDPVAEQLEGQAPQHQMNVRSYCDLPRNFQLDAAAYYVDALRDMAVPSYSRVDARLGWRPKEDLDLSFVVQNALNNRHLEFRPLTATPVSRIGRAVYGKITWRF